MRLWHHAAGKEIWSNYFFKPGWSVHGSLWTQVSGQTSHWSGFTFLFSFSRDVDELPAEMEHICQCDGRPSEQKVCTLSASKTNEACSWRSGSAHPTQSEHATVYTQCLSLPLLWWDVVTHQIRPKRSVMTVAIVADDQYYINAHGLWWWIMTADEWVILVCNGYSLIKMIKWLISG